MDYDYSAPSVKEKQVQILQNGDPISKTCTIKLSQNLKMSDIAKLCESEFDLQYNKDFRLFKSEGVQIFQEDIQYLKDGSTLFASQGEDFDSNSTFSQYELVQTLGEGGFGKVLLGVHKATKQKVAIKILKSGSITNAADIDMIFRQADIMKSLCHKNIVKIINCYTLSNKQVVITMEYLEGGELLARVEEAGRFTEADSKLYFQQIAQAMAYCHKIKLIHRDLQLENVLLVSPKSTEVRIVDFGIAGSSSSINVQNIDAGSLRYMCPQVLGGQLRQLTPSIDIWAMGVMLYLMLTGQWPFGTATSSNKYIVDKIMEGKYEMPQQVEKETSQSCKDLLRKLLDVNHLTRPSAAEILNHPWLYEKDTTFNIEEDKEESKEGFNNKKDFDNLKDKKSNLNQKDSLDSSQQGVGTGTSSTGVQGLSSPRGNTVNVFGHGALAPKSNSFGGASTQKISDSPQQNSNLGSTPNAVNSKRVVGGSIIGSSSFKDDSQTKTPSTSSTFPNPPKPQK